LIQYNYIRFYSCWQAAILDAAPLSTVIENADSSRHIDRNGILCYNHLAIAGSPYTAHTTVELTEDFSYNPGQTWWEKICDWWRNVPKWIKIGIGLIVIIALTIATIATGGAAGGLAGAVCAGALKGAVIGATSGAVISGTIEGLVSAHNNQGFWDGFANGAADGFMFGSISGAIAGGISAYSNYGNFASADKLQSHFEDHGRELGYASKTEYVRDAKYVIRHGQKVTHIYKDKVSVGYIKFYGNKGHANYAFVGMNGKYTATFEVRSVEKLIEMGINLFGL